MDLKLLQPEKKNAGLLSAERAVLLYIGLTTLCVLIMWGTLSSPLSMLTSRAIILTGMALFYVLYRTYPSRLTRFLRIVYLLFALGTLYTDTYYFCSSFQYLDHIFASIDQEIFGFQPALAFSQNFSNIIVSELLYLGYFSYYPMILALCIYSFLCHPKRFERTMFIILSCFMMYYLIYDFLPVAGPQYYYQVADTSKFENYYFPTIPYQYFQTHPEITTTVGKGGLFQHLVEMLQAGGEHPTAAFPSSHVGISTIVLTLAFKMNRRFGYILLPFYLLLCLATVYILAHYAVDVVAGWISAIIFYKIARQLYNTSFFHLHHEHNHHYHHHEN